MHYRLKAVRVCIVQSIYGAISYFVASDANIVLVWTFWEPQGGRRL